VVPLGGFQNDLELAFGMRESWPLDWIGFLDFLLSGGRLVGISRIFLS
jgi:hypothetical protein